LAPRQVDSIPCDRQNQTINSPKPGRHLSGVGAWGGAEGSSFMAPRGGNHHRIWVCRVCPPTQAFGEGNLGINLNHNDGGAKDTSISAFRLQPHSKSRDLLFSEVPFCVPRDIQPYVPGSLVRTPPFLPPTSQPAAYFLRHTSTHYSLETAARYPRYLPTPRETRNRDHPQPHSNSTSIMEPWRMLLSLSALAALPAVAAVKGNFLATCSDANVASANPANTPAFNDFVSASCKTVDGKSQATSMDLNLCVGFDASTQTLAWSPM